MERLAFNLEPYNRKWRIKINPLNVKNLTEYTDNLNNQLRPFIKRINEKQGYITLFVSENGQSVETHEICATPELLQEIETYLAS